MNLVVLHKLGDLQAAGDAGSRAARIAEGLIADASTRIVYHQDEGQSPITRALLGLSETEGRLLSMLSTGQALWRVGARSFIVQHYRSRLEARLTDTDTGMRIAAPPAGQAAARQRAVPAPEVRPAADARGDALRCDGVRRDGVRCDGVRCDGVRCDGVRCAAIQRHAGRGDAVRCDAVQGDAVRADALHGGGRGGALR